MFTILSHQGNTIKTTLRFHLIPARIVKIKNTSDSPYCSVCEAKGTPLHCCWECKLVATLEINTVVSYKFENQSTIRPSYTTPRYIPKGHSTVVPGHLFSEFIVALFVIARTWKLLWDNI